MGRLIEPQCIFGCMIGIYFVSMMMVFMTQKSILKENEYKAFKLITRLNAKDEKKNLNSLLIYHSFNLSIQKRLKQDNQIDEKRFHINYNREKQRIFDLIIKIKSYDRLFSTFDLTTQDHLYEISNRIDLDFKEMEEEIENLKRLFFLNKRNN